MQADRHERPRICIVVAAPLTLKVAMLGHLRELAKFADVTAVADFTPQDEAFPWPGGLTRVAVPITRPISLRSDLAALLALFRLFKTQRFDLVHSITSKAGLLAVLASRLCGTRLRLHTYTGQIWVTRAGLMRSLLKNADRLIARLATHVLADSVSQREFLIAQGIVGERQSTVLCQGSICGVDTEQFRSDAAARERVRRSHGIPLGAVAFLYLGRISRDKGLLDLARAFAEVSNLRPDTHLLLVGPDEDDLRAKISATAACAAKLHCVDFTDRPQEYFAAADVFCLPSYREGFPTSILQAAATGLPSIASRIYGITDAIVEDETGLLFAPGDARQLAQCMNQLAADEALRTRMGHKARERAVHAFSSRESTAALMAYYRELLPNRTG